MTTEPSLATNTQFGDFLIRRALGQGAYGSVYEAAWTKTGGRVALKVLHKKHLDGADAVARFLREAETLQKIDHPHVVDVLDYGDLDGLPYIVLEYLEGVPLDRRTSTRAAMPLTEVLDIMVPVLGAVDAMHRAGIVHRDLKPGNVYILQDANSRPRPKVLDFGLAKMVRAPAAPGITQPAIGMGTPNYMSPEQIRDASSATPKSDQFAIGVMLYFMLTGQRPFEAKSDMDVVHRVLGGDFTPPGLLVPTLPTLVTSAIVRALQADPELRFPSLRELARVLLPFASSETRTAFAHAFDDPTERVGASVRASGKREIAPLRDVLVTRALRDKKDAREHRRLSYLWGAIVASATASIVASLLLSLPVDASRQTPEAHVPPNVTTSTETLRPATTQAPAAPIVVELPGGPIAPEPALPDRPSALPPVALTAPERPATVPAVRLVPSTALPEPGNGTPVTRRTTRTGSSGVSAPLRQPPTPPRPRTPRPTDQRGVLIF